MALPTNDNGTLDFKAILESAYADNAKAVRKVRVVEYHVFLMMVVDGKYRYASDNLVFSSRSKLKSFQRKLYVNFYSDTVSDLHKDSDISKFSLNEAAKGIAVEDLKISMDIIERLVEVH